MCVTVALKTNYGLIRLKRFVSWFQPNYVISFFSSTFNTLYIYVSNIQCDWVETYCLGVATVFKWQRQAETWRQDTI
jgi:hypothetical protein